MKRLSKQDKQGVRRPTELERKYSFGRTFTEQDETNKSVSERVQALTKTVSENAKASGAAFEVIGERLDGIDVSVDELQETDIKLDQRLSSAEDVNTAQGEAIDKLTERMTAAEDVNTAQGESITALTKRMTAAESTGTAQAESISGLTERATAAETANAAQDDLMAELTERVGELETTVTALTERLTAAEEALAALEERVAALEEGEEVT